MHAYWNDWDNGRLLLLNKSYLLHEVIEGTVTGCTATEGSEGVACRAVFDGSKKKHIREASCVTAAFRLTISNG